MGLQRSSGTNGDDVPAVTFPGVGQQRSAGGWVICCSLTGGNSLGIVFTVLC